LGTPLGLEHILTRAGIPVQSAKESLGMDRISQLSKSTPNSDGIIDRLVNQSKLMAGGVLNAKPLGESVGSAGGGINKAYQLLEYVYRPTAGRLIGQHVGWPMAGRVGLGAAAALAPALLGSLLTDPAPQ